MNYIPNGISYYAQDSNSTVLPAENSSKTKYNSIQVDTQCGDNNTNEHQLTVSSTDAGLFEGSDQISVSDVPSDQRKKNSFYCWFKRKLWCIRRSKSADSSSLKNQTFRNRNAKIEIKTSTSVDQLSQDSPLPEPKVAEEATVKKQTGVISVQPATPVKKSAPVARENVSTKQQTPELASAPKERQVTFSDTVKTHIKTKYVTAEEYQQIRGNMDMNNHTILYQYSRSVEPKNYAIDEKSTFTIRNTNKPDHRKFKHTNESVTKM